MLCYVVKRASAMPTTYAIDDLSIPTRFRRTNDCLRKTTNSCLYVHMDSNQLYWAAAPPYTGRQKESLTSKASTQDERERDLFKNEEQSRAKKTINRPWDLVLRSINRKGRGGDGVLYRNECSSSSMNGKAEQSQSPPSYGTAVYK